jgi:hypothetical protein
MLQNKNKLAALGATVVALPVATAFAADTLTPTAGGAGLGLESALGDNDARAQMHAAGIEFRHDRLVHRNFALERAIAEAKGDGSTLNARERDRVRGWSIRKLKRENRELKSELRALQAAPVTATVSYSGGGGGASASLEAIARCESGGNPRAIGGGGAYRGKYQFDYGTWASVGGKGDPAAASEAEQDKRAAMLQQRSGNSPWPVCGS